MRFHAASVIETIVGTPADRQKLLQAVGIRGVLAEVEACVTETVQWCLERNWERRQIVERVADQVAVLLTLRTIPLHAIACLPGAVVYRTARFLAVASLPQWLRRDDDAVGDATDLMLATLQELSANGTYEYRGLGQGVTFCRTTLSRRLAYQHRTRVSVTLADIDALENVPTPASDGETDGGVDTAEEVIRRRLVEVLGPDQAARIGVLAALRSAGLDWCRAAEALRDEEDAVWEDGRIDLPYDLAAADAIMAFASMKLTATNLRQAWCRALRAATDLATQAQPSTPSGLQAA